MDGQGSNKKQEFLEFVLGHYVGSGVDELDTEKLGTLLRLRYGDSIVRNSGLGEAGGDQQGVYGVSEVSLSAWRRWGEMKRYFISPLRGWTASVWRPTACAVGCILSLLRGYEVCI